jgi:hypothetical protein
MNISIEILLAATTSLTALIAVYIAYQQYRTNREHEYREARAARLLVYKKIKRFLAEVDGTSKISLEAYGKLNDAIAEADFLFPEEVNDWLSDIHCNAAEWLNQKEGIDQHIKKQGWSEAEAQNFIAGNTDFFKSATDLMEECMDDLQNAHCELKSRFDPYLGEKLKRRISKTRG